MPKTISSLSGYISILKGLRRSAPAGATFLFRGQGQLHAEPVPKIFRNLGHQGSENSMLLKLISQSPREFSEDSFAFDRLVRAQHFGIPTRLLDVSTNPMTALFFAVSESSNSRGHVLIYSVKEREVKFFNSDSVSCVANLAYLTQEERHILKITTSRVAKEIFKKLPRGWSKYKVEEPENWENYVSEFNKEAVVKRLVQFIKEEKPYFENKIDPLTLYRIIAVTPKLSNQRLVAQAGGFFLFGLAENNTSSPSSTLAKSVEIAFDKKGSLLEELNAVGVNQATVYPELDKIAKGISDRARTD